MKEASKNAVYLHWLEIEPTNLVSFNKLMILHWKKKYKYSQKRDPLKY